MAKNKGVTDIFGVGVGDLIASTKKNVEARNTQHTQHTHDTQHTQRKQKYPRINMAFYGDNLEYVREAAYEKRISVTEYINQLIVDDKNRKLAALNKENAAQLSIEDME